jgi:hypothetical protein
MANAFMMQLIFAFHFVLFLSDGIGSWATAGCEGLAAIVPNLFFSKPYQVCRQLVLSRLETFRA